MVMITKVQQGTQAQGTYEMEVLCHACQTSRMASKSKWDDPSRVRFLPRATSDTKEWRSTKWDERRTKVSAPPAAHNGAQAQAMQVRFPGLQGRASLDGAPLQPLRPPARKMRVVNSWSHELAKCTHTHTHTHIPHVHVCTRSYARYEYAQTQTAWVSERGSKWASGSVNEWGREGGREGGSVCVCVCAHSDSKLRVLE